MVSGSGAASMKKYRKQRSAIEGPMAPALERDGTCALGLSALAARSRAVAPVSSALRALAAECRLTAGLDQVVASLIHMHANRLLHAAARAQEFVLHDMLDRFCTSREARIRKRG